MSEEWKNQGCIIRNGAQCLPRRVCHWAEGLSIQVCRILWFWIHGSQPSSPGGSTTCILPDVGDTESASYLSRFDSSHCLHLFLLIISTTPSFNYSKFYPEPRLNKNSDILKLQSQMGNFKFSKDYYKNLSFKEISEYKNVFLCRILRFRHV